MANTSKPYLAHLGLEGSVPDCHASTNRNLFFSWKIFREHNPAGTPCACKFLSLGDRNSDWWKATAHSRIELYKMAIVQAQPILEEARGCRIDLNQTQALVGHLCIALAGRIARTLVQVDKVDGEIVLAASPEKYAFITPRNSSESYKLLVRPQFSNYIDASLLLMKSSVEYPIDLKISKPAAKPELSSALKAGYVQIAQLLASLTRKSSHLIIGSYLGRTREALLSLRLGQIPLLVEIRRERVVDSPSTLPHGEFYAPSVETLIRECLKILIPTSLLQMEAAENRYLVGKGWPRFPRTVFTSNNFDTDDDFKNYLSHHWNSVRYVVGQHGNNYGTSQNSLFYPETWLPDTFLTWGWSAGQNSTRLGVLKPIKAGPSKKNRNGFLIVLRDANWLQVESDVDLTNEVYFREISNLVSSLVDAGCRVLVRPHPATPNWALDRIRLDCDNSALLSFSRKGEDLAIQQKDWFPVFGYDSTGMLELASIGNEFFAYVPDGLEGIRRQFRDVYKHMEESKLISTCQDSALEALLEIRDANFKLSLDQRESIALFASELATQNKSLIGDLAKILDNRAEHSDSTLLDKSQTRWPSLE
jgi:putative transferase (TIGR04331 family)